MSAGEEGSSFPDGAGAAPPPWLQPHPAPVHLPAGCVAVRHHSSGGLLGADPATKRVFLYRNADYGQGQLWKFNGDGTVTSNLDESGGLVLGVLRSEAGAELQLLDKKQSHVKFNYQRNHGLLVLRRQEMALAVRNDDLAIILRNADSRDGELKWVLVGEDPEAIPRPAAACHMRYQVEDVPEEVKNWKLRCSVRVTDTARGSYFCAMAWGGGGGYAGVQDRPGGKRFAIFSMWDSKEGDRVEKEDPGDEGVRVSRFSGEGTGLKSETEFDWKLGEEVTFTVEGRREGGFWLCGCRFEAAAGSAFRLATFRRAGQQPAWNRKGFHSFVEDYHRPRGSRGHEVLRSAEFLNPTYQFNDGEWVECRAANFTKVERGLASFSAHKATGGILQDGQQPGFFLATGGKDTQGTSRDTKFHL